MPGVLEGSPTAQRLANGCTVTVAVMSILLKSRFTHCHFKRWNALVLQALPTALLGYSHGKISCS